MNWIDILDRTAASVLLDDIEAALDRAESAIQQLAEAANETAP
jgi:hypothetical protein